MDFLRDEFEGVPPVVVQTALKQLEAAIRDAHRVMTIGDPTLQHNDLQYMAICATIRSVVEFVRKFKIVSDEQNGSGTP